MTTQVSSRAMGGVKALAPSVRSACVRPFSAARVSIVVKAEGERLRLNNLGPEEGSRRRNTRKGRGHGAGQVRCLARVGVRMWPAPHYLVATPFVALCGRQACEHAAPATASGSFLLYSTSYCCEQCSRLVA
eukprot:364362-Chlamydomonas_euryale.AAC.6